VLRWPDDLFYWDYTGKKVIPIIARGVELGVGDKSFIPRFWRGPESPGGALLGIADIIPDNEFWQLSDSLGNRGKNAVQSLDDYAMAFLMANPLSPARTPLTARRGILPRSRPTRRRVGWPMTFRVNDHG
jgi:hypothetical protein